MSEDTLSFLRASKLFSAEMNSRLIPLNEYHSRSIIGKSSIWTNHRTVISKHWRNWEITRLPGFVYLEESVSAFCAIKRASKYWRFVLDYDELDNCFPLDGTFGHILETCGPYEIGAIWKAHETSCSRGASLAHGDWRWWSGRGLSREMVEALRAAVIARYTKASEIIAT